MCSQKKTGEVNLVQINFVTLPRAFLIKKEPQLDNTTELFPPCRLCVRSLPNGFHRRLTPYSQKRPLDSFSGLFYCQK